MLNIVALVSRAFFLASFFSIATQIAGAEPLVVNLWEGIPPGENGSLPPEDDTPGLNDREVAGRQVQRIKNVSVPQLAIYRPEKPADSKAAIVICPGGGHRILAYDLEGVEIAQWLNGLGITGIVLKYRVPFRDESDKSRAAVQDAQRAIRIVRNRSAELGVAPDKIGMMGFSAGGEVAAKTCLLHSNSYYTPVDSVDEASCRPDFGMLIYPAYLTDEKSKALKPEVIPDSATPPMFMVHAWDDRITPLSSILLAAELKKVAIPCELHLFQSGGHGYGARHVDGVPVTDWTKLGEGWLAGLLQ
jgi:acetyl esterase/lipase